MSGGRAHARPLLFGSAEDPSARGIDSPANSSRQHCAMQSTTFSPCQQMLSTVPGRLRHVAHVAPSRCASCEERPGSADCPTCTRSNAGAVRYHIPRKVAQQDGATLICLVCFANRRGNAVDWLLWLKTPKIDRFGFVCPSTGWSWPKGWSADNLSTLNRPHTGALSGSVSRAHECAGPH